MTPSVNPEPTSILAPVHVVGEDRVRVESEGAFEEYELQAMPDRFFKWQLDSRSAMFGKLGRERQIASFHAHLPVAATFSDSLRFRVHTATKATGLMPRDEYLEEYNRDLTSCIEAATKDGAWEESKPARIEAARRVYEHPERIDRRRLGLIEIFQGQTYHNLSHNPLMALQYTGPGPEYVSFQVNGVVEMVGPGDPRFEFLYLMRHLFEYDSFHVQQPAYPSGFVFWISEVYDKSPRGPAGRRMD